MPGNWIRPSHIPFPSVWHSFDGKREINGVIPKFWVQDLPTECYETVLTTMLHYFIEDEPLSKFSKAKLDPRFAEDLRNIWMECLKNKVALACFMKNPDPKGKPIMVGVNVTYVAENDEQKLKFGSEKFLKLITTLDYVTNMKDPFKFLKINKYLGAMGLIIPPEYRGNGIGFEMLKAREAVCKAFDLKVTVTVFTSIFSQTIAAKCGFKVLSEIDYEELERQNPKLRYPSIQNHTKTLKIMYWKF